MRFRFLTIAAVFALYPLGQSAIALAQEAALASEASSVVESATQTDAEEAHQAERQMDLSLVLSHTYQYNPTLLAARAALRSTQERLPQAFAGWLPTVSSEASINVSDISGSNFGSSDGSTAKGVGLSLSQPLYRGGSTFAEVSSARHAIRAQEANLQSVEQDTVLDAITAYADVLRDQTLLTLSEKTRGIIAREFEASNDRFEVGEITKTDVSQAKARLASADSDVITARGDLMSSKAAFFQVTGLMVTDLRPVDAQPQMPATLESAVEQAQNANPLIDYAMSIHKASEEDVEDVFGELLPSISLSSGWNRTYDPAPGIIPEQTTKSIGLTASIPLYQAGGVRSRVRAARHVANQRYIEIHEARREVEELVVRSWSDWRTAGAEIDSRRAQVDALMVAQEGVRAESEFGSRTVLNVLDADQEVFEAEVALAQAQRNEITAKFALLSSLGGLTPDAVGFGDLLGKIIADQPDFKDNIFNIDVDRVNVEQ